MNSITSTLNKTKKLGKSELFSIGIVIVGLIYYSLNEPMLMTVLAIVLSSTFAFFLFANFLSSEIFGFQLKIRRWHVLAIALGTTLCFTAMETPSHALLFEALEEVMGDILAATGDAVEEEIITGLFMFFRVVVILAFVGAAILGVTQALQGSDWRPIANMMGIGVGLVLSIEVITNLIVGGA